MYESPINQVSSKISSEIIKCEDDQLMYKIRQTIGYDIDKTELVRALRYDREQYEKGYADGLNVNRWIPCGERLPEDDQAVLVWCPQYKNIYCAYLEKEQWWIFGAFVQIVPNGVVAWMPLPNPYKASPTGAESEDKE